MTKPPNMDHMTIVSLSVCIMLSQCSIVLQFIVSFTIIYYFSATLKCSVKVLQSIKMIIFLLKVKKTVRNS